MSPFMGEGGWFLIVQVHFIFCSLNFIILFLFLIKYYHIMFIIVSRLGCDTLFSRIFAGFLLSLPRDQTRDATPRLGEGGRFFIFIWSPFYFLLIEFHCAFSISYIVPTCYVYYYCIWLYFNTLFCVFAGFLLFSPKGFVTDVTPRLGVSVILQRT